jgi:hypothetical protein
MAKRRRWRAEDQGGGRGAPSADSWCSQFDSLAKPRITWQAMRTRKRRR